MRSSKNFKFFARKTKSYKFQKLPNKKTGFIFAEILRSITVKGFIILILSVIFSVAPLLFSFYKINISKYIDQYLTLNIIFNKPNTFIALMILENFKKIIFSSLVHFIEPISDKLKRLFEINSLRSKTHRNFL